MSENEATAASSTETPVESMSFEEGELGALGSSHDSERYSTDDFETLIGVGSELERADVVADSTEEAILTDGDRAAVVAATAEPSVENESGAGSDVETARVPPEQVGSDPILYATSDRNGRNIIFQTKPTFQRVPITAVQVKPNIVGQPAQSQSIMIVSPADGQGASQILKISHPASASAGQLRSLAQTLVTAKSTSDGNVVRLRAAGSGESLAASTGQRATTAIGDARAVESLRSAKRSARNARRNRNVCAKMILSGEGSAATSRSDTHQPRTIKFLTATSGNQGIATPTKTITLAQVQQMGLVASEVRHALPSSPRKQQGLIVNKVIQSSSSQPPKLTLIPTSGAKSPTKILPAPATVSNHVGPSNSQTSISTSGKAIVQQSPQKVIIRQSALKPGTVLGGGQVIRIPANQNIVTGANQLHQIQMPGRQVQYVRLVSTPSSGTTNVVTVGKPKPQAGTLQTVGVTQKIGDQQIVKVVPLNTSGGAQPLRTVAPKSSMSNAGQRLLIPASGALSHAKNTVAIPASALSQLASGQAVISTSANVGNIVVLPAQYVHPGAADESKGKSPSASSLLSSSQSSQSSSGNLSVNLALENKNSQRAYSGAEPNGIRPRKPCNCTKSQCLKLYCDCFANGEFCHMCNCNNCSNNLGNEEERQRAIKSCLERNPNAFRPKIGKGRDTGDDIRRHNKGCNCKRSGCLKNYCECYEAKIPCSANCKCIGCRNIEEPPLEKKTLKDLAEAVEVRTAQLSLNKSKIQPFPEMAFRPQATSNSGARQTFNFLTDKVVEITCQCLLAQAEEADRNMLDEDTSQRLIIEEFGRCLKEIIESAHKAEAT